MTASPHCIDNRGQPTARQSLLKFLNHIAKMKKKKVVVVVERKQIENVFATILVITSKK